jgi:hypothetical protein
MRNKYNITIVIKGLRNHIFIYSVDWCSEIILKLKLHGCTIFLRLFGRIFQFRTISTTFRLKLHGCTIYLRLFGRIFQFRTISTTFRQVISIPHYFDSRPQVALFILVVYLFRPLFGLFGK